jgi:hypothetical protein
MKHLGTRWFLVLIALLVIGQTVYFIFRKGEARAKALVHEIRYVDMSAAGLAINFSDLPLERTEDHTYRAVLFGVDTFITRTYNGEVDGIYFHSRCNDYNANADTPLNDEYDTMGSNQLNGGRLYLEHSIRATKTEVCAWRADGEPFMGGSIRAKEVEFGHIKAPYLKLAFTDPKDLEVQIIQRSGTNLIAITWR